MAKQQTQPDLPLDRVFHALADDTRLAVIQRLAHGPASVSELAQPFDMALPTFMKHLKVLEAGGWITTQKAGRVRTCELSPLGIGSAQAWISRHRAIWEGRADRMARLLEELQKKEKKQ